MVHLWTFHQKKKRFLLILFSRKQTVWVMDRHSLSIHWYEETKKRLSEDGDTSIIEQIQKTKKRVGGERAARQRGWALELCGCGRRSWRLTGVEREGVRERRSYRRRDDTGDERGAWECVGVQRKGCAVPASARRGIRSSETASSRLPRCASARQPSQSLQASGREGGRAPASRYWLPETSWWASTSFWKIRSPIIICVLWFRPM